MSKANQEAALWTHDRGKAQGRIGLVGVDEAGRGALAGPVVAGAVYLPSGFFEKRELQSASMVMKDSKKLQPEQREEAFTLLHEWEELGLASLAVGSASVEEIEAYNILGATRLAMTRALELLQEKRKNHWNLERGDADSWFAMELPGNSSAGQSPRVLLDGRPMVPFAYRHEALVRGDGRSLSIAMASILAKVTRDQGMRALAQEYADYGFQEHKGYGTALHREVLLEVGPCQHHRKGFLSRIRVDSPATFQEGLPFHPFPENP